jgi:hypothetical protein
LKDYINQNTLAQQGFTEVPSRDRKWGTVGDLQQAFKNVYGDQFGYSPEFQKLLFEQGKTNLQPQFNTMKQQGLSDINNRGFYSAVPYSNMVSNANAVYGRALGGLQSDISVASGQAAEQQKASLFGAQSQYLTAYNLAELEKRLSKKDFMDFLGQLTGQAAQVAMSYVGAKFGIGKTKTD